MWRARVVVRTGRAQKPGDAGGVAEHLRRLLAERPGELEPYDLSSELGQGELGESIVAASFWVRADDVGGAAVTALHTMTSSYEAVLGERATLYELVLVPEDAVVRHPGAGGAFSVTAVRTTEPGS